MKKKRLNWLGIGMFSVCILAFISAAFSMKSTVSLTNQINSINQNTYVVKSHLQKVRSRLSEIRLILPSLLEYDNTLQKEHIYNLLSERDEIQDETIQDIRKHYLGSQKDIDELQKAFYELREARTLAVEIYAPKSDIKNILKYFEKNIDPYSDKILDELEEIEAHVDTNMINATKNSGATMIIDCIVTSALFLVIVLMVIVTISVGNKRNREAQYIEKLFELLSTYTEDVFFIYNVSKKQYEYVSTNSFKLLGIKNSKFHKKPLIISEYLSKESKKKYNDIANAGDIYDIIETDLEFCKDGVSKNLKLRIYPVLSKNKLTQNIAVITDQTKDIEIQNVLKDALLNAQKASDAKRDFLSRMSHEIRTPMNTIIGMNTIALRHIDDIDYVVDCLKKVSLSSTHLLSLINDILDMSKIEDNKFSINNVQFDFKSLIESITSLIYPQAEAKNQIFNINITNLTEETLIGDSLRVNQVLINLLSNALKFTPVGGQIDLDILKVRKNNSTIVIRFVVTDTGIGMSETFLEKLFMPFEQENSLTAQQYGGTGLGMSIAKNLVTLMNGKIAVESKINEGTKFIVEIPFGVVEESFESDRDFNDIKVLVVDDDKSTCEHAMVIMEQIGINASWVCSGREAVDSVMSAHEKGEDYDVCFIDWCMPEMDGVETARNIRKKLGPDTLIIIISAYDWSLIEHEAREAGVNAFVSKPMFTSTIYDTLNTVIFQKNAKTVNNSNNKVEYNFNGKKVLLAEDNMINQEIATILLEEAGVKVDWVENGKLAVEKFESSANDEYSAILMDIQMPVMNGYESSMAIRKSSHTNAKTIPIIAMTANAFNEDIQLTKKAGMNGHISKPIDIGLLYKTLAEFI